MCHCNLIKFTDIEFFLNRAVLLHMVCHKIPIVIQMSIYHDNRIIIVRISSVIEFAELDIFSGFCYS